MSDPDLLTILLGGVAGLVTAFAKDYLGLRVKTDESTRQKRIENYPALWQATGVAPRYPRDDQLTYDRVSRVARQLRTLYYGPSGLYLSRSSQREYEILQKVLERIVNDADGGRSVSDTDYDKVSRTASRLRTSMTDDLLSRNRYPWSRLMSRWEDFRWKHNRRERILNKLGVPSK
jgi:hypothetical protein